MLALSISIYGVMIFIGAPLLVPLGDKYSRELSLMAGLLIFTAGTVICALAHNIFFFFLGRALSGLAAGAFVPTAYALVGDRVPYAHRGKVMGLIVSSWSLALIFGVPIGSFIGGVLNWRWTFWIFALMAVLVASLIFIEARHSTADGDKTEEESGRQAGTFRDALKVPRVPVYLTITFCNMIGFYGMYSFLGTYLHRVFAGGKYRFRADDHGVRNRVFHECVHGENRRQGGKNAFPDRGIGRYQHMACLSRLCAVINAVFGHRVIRLGLDAKPDGDLAQHHFKRLLTEPPGQNHGILQSGVQFGRDIGFGCHGSGLRRIRVCSCRVYLCGRHPHRLWSQRFCLQKIWQT